ncbi:MAG: nucleotidyltransferase domain-containing protein [Defluviitoga tunisiensis]|jgi:predicted nucleotidyltransferase|uniref:Nucleotidyltransferases n=1 Tax=Defluviitoga tunisiensis TaxID=1006576 RepID=A0A0C7P385_DEFTU|nr:nucleotidyltransferase domain-containing protein [Defluviitoga tunisiensis]HQD35460.1 nucleotidyltransferase domain-containing protein [Bacteroidales bacterium]CEP78344.1 nucleotidyltransferases [Defluviitoga tunisiensis]HHV01613.1 nucleotidyltransferase domain-containing protein [Defluviitoga tunisiensis]HOL87162.1 nucleotidyltransferase domain-containing protein [Defluviitoga tunisiensis]HPP11034.1 nucleotidyltransferase domain-containing protein [Defluviitoga tunisiensis]
MITQQQIDIIKNFLIKNLDVDVIYLFGSSVKNTMREDSDIDIAFLSEKSVDPFDLFLLSQKLADLVGREVDLIDIKKATTVFQTQIISTGIVIYSRDEKKRAIFEMITYKSYARLNEEREEILDKIKESGSIYAK